MTRLREWDERKEQRQRQSQLHITANLMHPRPCQVCAEKMSAAAAAGGFECHPTCDPRFAGWF